VRTFIAKGCGKQNWTLVNVDSLFGCWKQNEKNCKVQGFGNNFSYDNSIVTKNKQLQLLLYVMLPLLK